MLSGKNNIVSDLEKLLSAGDSAFKTSVGKDIFLVIGNLGAGKSTAISYFMGSVMRKDGTKGIGRGVVVSVRKPAHGVDWSEIPVIGHGQNSQTLYPRSHKVVGNLILCDCPGFGTSRLGIAETACESISIELSIKLAKAVAGVLVVIDYEEFFTSRGGKFKDLVGILTKLFGDRIAEAYNSLFFVVTKKPDGVSCDDVRKGLLERIASSVDPSKENARKYRDQFDSDNCEDYEEFDSIVIEKECELHFLQLLAASVDRFAVIDVLDGGKSWKTVQEAIVRLPKIDKSLFDFRQYSPHRVRFNKYFYSIIDSAAQTLKSFQTFHAEIDTMQMSHKSCEQQILLYKERQNALQGSDAQSLTEQDDKLFEKFSANLKAISQSKEKIGILVKKYHELVTDLLRLDSDTAVKYLEDSVYEKRSAWYGLGFLSWTVKKFEYSNGVPILRVDTAQENGYFHVLNQDLGKGKYSAVYKSDYGKDGQASVVIYVQSKHEPGNVRLIAALNKEKCENEQMRVAIEAQINTIEEENEELSVPLNNISSEKKTRKAQVIECRQKIQEWEKKLLDVDGKVKQLRSKLALVEKQIISSMPLYQVADLIAEHLVFDSLLIQGFRSDLLTYKTRLRGMRELHVAVMQQDKELTYHYSNDKTLLNGKDDVGDTPLHLAVRHSFVEQAFILVLEGADVNLKNNNGKSSLDELLEKAALDDGSGKRVTDESLYLEFLALAIYSGGVKPDLKKVPGFDTQISDSVLGKHDVLAKINTPFKKSLDSIITNGISTSSAPTAFENSVHKASFREMRGFPELRSLLDVAAFAVLAHHRLGNVYRSGSLPQPLLIVIDTDRSNTTAVSLGDAEDSYGVYYNRENKIYLGGKRADDPQVSKPLARGTFIHEICHFVANEVFQNSCNPYFSNDQENKKRFTVICDSLYNKKQTLHDVLRAVFDRYEESQWHVELIVRIPQLIAICDDYRLVMDQCPELLQYYRQIFMPPIQRHVRDLRYDARVLSLDVLSRPAKSAIFDAVTAESSAPSASQRLVQQSSIVERAVRLTEVTSTFFKAVKVEWHTSSKDNRPDRTQAQESDSVIRCLEMPQGDRQALEFKRYLGEQGFFAQLRHRKGGVPVLTVNLAS